MKLFRENERNKEVIRRKELNKIMRRMKRQDQENNKR